MQPSGKLVQLVGGPLDGTDYELVSTIRPPRIHVAEGRKNVVFQYVQESQDTYGFDGVWKWDPSHKSETPHFDRIES